MNVIQINSNTHLEVPNYYSIYSKWYDHYEKTGNPKYLTLAYHYARVAEEFGQASIEDETTAEIPI